MTLKLLWYMVLDESMEKSMDYSPKSFGGHKPLLETQFPASHYAMPTFKSRYEKFPYNLNQHYPYLSYGIPCRFFIY